MFVMFRHFSIFCIFLHLSSSFHLRPLISLWASTFRRISGAVQDSPCTTCGLQISNITNVSVYVCVVLKKNSTNQRGDKNLRPHNEVQCLDRCSLTMAPVSCHLPSPWRVLQSSRPTFWLWSRSSAMMRNKLCQLCLFLHVLLQCFGDHFLANNLTSIGIFFSNKSW